MTWYTASIITTVKSLAGNQDIFPVFEDFYLIEAPGRQVALKKAEAIGMSLQHSEERLEFDNKPAKREFIGVRKLRSIYNPADAHDVDESAPMDGTELTHSYFEVKEISDLEKFVNGERVSLEYVDDDIA